MPFFSLVGLPERHYCLGIGHCHGVDSRSRCHILQMFNPPLLVFEQRPELVVFPFFLLQLTLELFSFFCENSFFLNAFSVRAPISALLALGGPISALLTWRAVFRNSWPGKLLLEVETIFIRLVTLKNMQIDTLNIIFGHHEIMPRGGYTSTWKS